VDPFTQGALGAAFAQTSARREQARVATALGVLSGMAPDLDVLISSKADPLLFLEFHRHFTHSLAFIPVGALICAGCFYYFARRRLSFGWVYLFCLLGYSSHGLLDAFTTYGTQLLWPFSSLRVAWNMVSVVDPLFSVPLAVMIVLAFSQRRRRWTALGLIWCSSYLAFGWWQGQRVEAAGWELAAARGHQPERLEAKPGFGSLLLWKLVYEYEGAYHVDAVRVGAEVRIYPGDRARKLDITRDLPWLVPDSVQAVDLERFRWFSNDYLAVAADNEVVDVRYSMLPNEVEPLWGIRLSPAAAADAHVSYFTAREARSEQVQQLIDMLLGRNP
jgi:inner membrane protein